MRKKGIQFLKEALFKNKLIMEKIANQNGINFILFDRSNFSIRDTRYNIRFSYTFQ